MSIAARRPWLWLAIASLVVWLALDHPAAPPVEPAPALSAAALLAADPEGFERAIVPRPFVFPRDHGPHPAFRTEWWYFTGNLQSPGERAFGFQLTLFRFGLAAGQQERDSAWATRDAWMGHLALTDVERGEHTSFERFARGALGLAGAEAAPLRVWLQDWVVRGTGGDAFPMHLVAGVEALGITLALRPEKPPVAQGEAGLSRKSAAPGNASYYYSYTRLAATGTVRTHEGTFPVDGTAWLDREWSTSALAPDQVGWDWFALQLSDGSDLMFYRLRLRDGRTDPASAGSLVAADGTRRALGVGEVRLEPLERWRSPDTGVQYPLRWRLRTSDGSIDLEIAPRAQDQEMNTSFRYWEGAVTAAGTAAGNAVTGVGYLELTGYGTPGSAGSAGSPR